MIRAETDILARFLSHEKSSSFNKKHSVLLLSDRLHTPSLVKARHDSGTCPQLSRTSASAENKEVQPCGIQFGASHFDQHKETSYWHKRWRNRTLFPAWEKHLQCGVSLCLMKQTASCAKIRLFWQSCEFCTALNKGRQKRSICIWLSGWRCFKWRKFRQHTFRGLQWETSSKNTRVLLQNQEYFNLCEIQTSKSLKLHGPFFILLLWVHSS